MAKDYRLEKRKFVIGGIALSIVLIYLIRLFVLQITTDDYKKNADSNAFLNKIQYPSRGAIYDRTGKLLVFNQPAYDITIVPVVEYYSCSISENHERHERPSPESGIFQIH